MPLLEKRPPELFSAFLKIVVASRIYLHYIYHMPATAGPDGRDKMKPLNYSDKDRATMNNLNTRSKITIRYTTNPADMGYDGTPSNWLTALGETMGIRSALDFSHALSQRIGQGVFRRIQYTNRGAVVTLDQIQDVINDAEYNKRFR